jgi:hypothetical protein
MSKENYTEIKSDALRQDLRNLCQTHTRACLMLAKGLFDVYYGTVERSGGALALHEAWGYETFGEYAEHELGIHAGPAMRYIAVYDELVIKRGFLDPKTGASFGKTVLPDSISKLRILAEISRRVTDTRDLVKWISRSLELSPCDFEAEVDKQFHIGKGRKGNITFHVPWTRLKPIMKALEAAKEQYSCANRAEALSRIVDEWASRQKNAGPAVAPKVKRAKRKHRHPATVAEVSVMQ